MDTLSLNGLIVTVPGGQGKMAMKYYWDDKEESQSTLCKIFSLSLWQPHILTLTALKLNLGLNRMVKHQLFPGI